MKKQDPTCKMCIRWKIRNESREGATKLISRVEIDSENIETCGGRKAYEKASVKKITCKG